MHIFASIANPTFAYLEKTLNTVSEWSLITTSIPIDQGYLRNIHQNLTLPNLLEEDNNQSILSSSTFEKQPLFQSNIKINKGIYAKGLVIESQKEEWT